MLLQATYATDKATIRAHLWYLLQEVLYAMRILGISFADDALATTAKQLGGLALAPGASDCARLRADLAKVVCGPL